MKKFLSMALAMVMACNFTLSISRNIAAAEGYYDEYVNFDDNYVEWVYKGYDDEYVYYKIPEEYLKELINDNRINVVKFDDKYVVIKLHKKDVKEIIEEKPSKLRKFLKAVLRVAYTGIVAITSCGLYRIYNQHIGKMDKEGKFTINENSTLLEKIDANVANYIKIFNSYVDGTISSNLFGNNSIFNRGINGTKSFFINNLNATQTFLSKLWPFGRKINSSNTQQQTSSSSNTNIQQQTNSSVSIVITATNSSNTQQPTQTSKPVKTPQPSPSPTSNLETETNGSTSIIPGGQQQVETNEQQGNNCGEGFIYKNGSCVPDNEQKNND